MVYYLRGRSAVTLLAPPGGCLKQDPHRCVLVVVTHDSVQVDADVLELMRTSQSDSQNLCDTVSNSIGGSSTNTQSHWLR